MFNAIVVGSAAFLTVLIWGIKQYNSSGSSAEDAMAGVPAMFATVFVWGVAIVLLLAHWLL